jgi:hypothetical protein
VVDDGRLVLRPTKIYSQVAAASTREALGRLGNTLTIKS